MTDSLVRLARASFPADYQSGRAHFLDLSAEARLELRRWRHPRAKGRLGEDLTIDAARIGPADAERLFILCSGTHGVEGFCGSGVLAAILGSGLHAELPKGVALVLVHALNPFGFSYLRRTNEENVDLNRNFLNHRDPHPANRAYDRIHPMLVPADWDGPGRAKADAELDSYIRRRGWQDLQAAVSGGQYDHADGLFFGGRRPAWSNSVWRDLLKTFAGHARYLAVLDFHTGLGARGACELISGAAEGSDEVCLARALFGSNIVFPGVSSTAPAALGFMGNSLAQTLPSVRSALAVAEYGTVPFDQIFHVLRADNWLHARGRLNSPLGRRIKAEMREAFYDDDDQWKAAVLERGLDLFRSTAAALEECDIA